MRQAEEIEALAARAAALAAVWEEPGDGNDGDTEALRSVRRIVRSMEPALELYGAGGLARLARRVRTARRDELEELVPPLLDGVRKTVGELPREPVEILVVESDPEQAAAVRAALEAAARRVTVVSSVEGAEGALEPDPPDLVVLRLELAGGDGRDLLLTLLDRPVTAAIPAVVLTSRRDPAIRAECFALGADELLPSRADPRILSAAVSSLLRRRATLTRLAQEDYLTGLPNRAGFARMFGRLQSLSSRTGAPLALALLDVDFLKEVNDRLGHATGDRMLEKLAAVSNEALRDSDVLARWGGDEFVVLLPNTDTGGARSAVDKARRSFREALSGHPELADENLAVSFSAGVTGVLPGEPMEEAVERADRLLYRAKALGRDEVVTRESADTRPRSAG